MCYRIFQISRRVRAISNLKVSQDATRVAFELVNLEQGVVLEFSRTSTLGLWRYYYLQVGFDQGFKPVAIFYYSLSRWNTHFMYSSISTTFETGCRTMLTILSRLVAFPALIKLLQPLSRFEEHEKQQSSFLMFSDTILEIFENDRVDGFQGKAGLTKPLCIELGCNRIHIGFTPHPYRDEVWCLSLQEESIHEEGRCTRAFCSQRFHQFWLLWSRIPIFSLPWLGVWWTGVVLVPKTFHWYRAVHLHASELVAMMA